MAAKRKLTDEFDSVSNAVLTESAIIHGVVASVSPMKSGKRAKFFEGKLTDGTKTMRMVGFRSHQQNQLATYQADAKPVALHDCELKPARQSLELEQYGTYSRAVTNFAKTHLNEIFAIFNFVTREGLSHF